MAIRDSLPAHQKCAGIRKKLAISVLLEKYKNSNKKFSKHMLPGGYNMDTPATKNFSLKLGTGFQHAKVTNSTGSRYNKNTMGRMIDQIYYAWLNSRPSW
ncbi:hypothetical protein AYI69_g1473 [Smittium culicis]|uniref:Uncharacterized protein n=1 Tax=Smittium culicis TaxID=133412 RepID=A0A1R1YQ68_9FUNG|nr:hypothetical protein AYI69_g1473 [Smittium culicis]